MIEFILKLRAADFLKVLSVVFVVLGVFGILGDSLFKSTISGQWAIFLICGVAYNFVCAVAEAERL